MNDALIAMLEDLCRAARENRIVMIHHDRQSDGTGTIIHAIRLTVKPETEFSGLSSLVKEACAIDLQERLKIAAQAADPK